MQFGKIDFYIKKITLYLEPIFLKVTDYSFYSYYNQIHFFHQNLIFE